MNLLKSPLADRYLSWLFPALLLASAFVYAWSVVGRLGSYPFVWLVLVIPVVVYLWVRGNMGWFWPVLPLYLLASSFWSVYVRMKFAGFASDWNFSRFGIEDVAAELARMERTLCLLPAVILLVVLVVKTWRDPLDLKLVLGKLPGRLTSFLSSMGGGKKTYTPEELEREAVLRRIGLDEPSEELVFCYDERRRPVAISGHDRYLHTLITGPTGTGKTSRILKPMIEQELKAIARSLVRGIPRGLTVIEPKGDLADDVAKMAHYYRVPVLYIDPLREDTCKFNPLEGEPSIVAEATRTVLQATFGRQEAFYSKVQEVAARNTVLLLKYLRRDDVTMNHMSQVLRDTNLLREEVNRLKDLIDSLDLRLDQAEASGDEKEIEWYRYLKRIERRMEELVSYFEVEVLGDNLAQKTHQFAMGLRLQVEDIAGNELLARVIGGRSDVDFDLHLNRGGVLVVNTAMGHLGKVGDAFGQFVIMHFQNSVFRRKGDEFSRARHMLVMDEAHRYINPDFERLLAMGRGFRCECILALQNTAQLALDEKRSFRDSVLNLCRNKIVFGGMDFQEAKFFANEFGENKIVRSSKSYSANVLFKKPWETHKVTEHDAFEHRFDYTSLIELPAYHVVYRIVRDGQAMPPGLGVTFLSHWDRHVRGKEKVKPGLIISDAGEEIPLNEEDIFDTKVVI
jgi:hypothetical protein